MDPNKLFDAIAELIAERGDCDVSEITVDSRFEDLRLDPQDTAQILMDLEDKIGVTAELDDRVETVGELVEYIMQDLEDR